MVRVIRQYKNSRYSRDAHQWGVIRRLSWSSLFDQFIRDLIVVKKKLWYKGKFIFYARKREFNTHT